MLSFPLKSNASEEFESSSSGYNFEPETGTRVSTSKLTLYFLLDKLRVCDFIFDPFDLNPLSFLYYSAFHVQLAAWEDRYAVLF